MKNHASLIKSKEFVKILAYEITFYLAKIPERLSIVFCKVYVFLYEVLIYNLTITIHAVKAQHENAEWDK